MPGEDAAWTSHKRIRGLAGKGGITADPAGPADEVRADGNAAAHDAREFNEDGARTSYDVAETFLFDVFQLPGVMAGRHQETAGRLIAGITVRSGFFHASVAAGRTLSRRRLRPNA
jgi:hypothetical protein